MNKLQIIIKSILDLSFWRKLSALLGGLLSAQAIGLFSLVILSRVYTPADFGLFAFYLATHAILVPITTLSLDKAVHATKSEQQLTNVTNACIFSVIIIGSIFAIFVLIYYFLESDLIVIERLSQIVYLFPLGATIGGAYALAQALAINRGQFATVGTAQFIQAITAAGISITAAAFAMHASGLIVGFIGGQILFIIISLKSRIRVMISRFSVRSVRIGISRNINFPKSVMIGEIVNSIGHNGFSLGAPVIFDVSSLGYYNFSVRVINAPFNSIALAFANIYRYESNPRNLQKTQLSTLTDNTAIRLTIIGFFIFVPFLIFGPRIFSFAFGEQWVVSGYFAQLLAPLLWIRFVASPISAILIVRNKMRIHTMIQVAIAAFSCLSLAIGIIYGNIESSIIFIAISHSCVYLLSLLISFDASRR